jgi:putative flippase GtrA
MSAGASPQPSLPDERARGWVAGFSRHIPPTQFGRYLLVGAWNTAFGYATFVLFTMLFSRVMAHGYIAASVISSLLNITVAYLGYKWFVFKTKGNYLREWARCLAVYSSAIVVSTLLLPVLVYAIRLRTSYFAAAPYIAGAVLIACTTVYSFLGHKKFSFRSSQQ